MIYHLKYKFGGGPAVSLMRYFVHACSFPESLTPYLVLLRPSLDSVLLSTRRKPCEAVETGHWGLYHVTELYDFQNLKMANYCFAGDGTGE